MPLLVLTPLTFLGGTFYSLSMLAQPWRSMAMANPVDNPSQRVAMDLLRPFGRGYPHFRRADAGVFAGVHNGDRGHLPDGVSVKELKTRTCPSETTKRGTFLPLSEWPSNDGLV